MRLLLNKNFFQVAIGFFGIIALSLLTFSVTTSYLETFYPDDDAFETAAAYSDDAVRE